MSSRKTRERARRKRGQTTGPGPALTPPPALASLPPEPEPPAGSEAMFAKLLPELTVFIMVAALLLIPDRVPWLDVSALEIAIMADVVMVMASASLVDVASRLRRAPPWWLGVLLAGAILLLVPGAGEMILMTWQEGMWIFLPFVWSLVERVRELWTLPSASRLEKIRRRTLTFDRVYTGLALGAMSVAGLVINDLVHDGNVAMSSYSWLMPLLVLLFYGAAAINAWRVHQPAFAKRPGSLWPWVDGGQATDLSPL